MRREERRLLFFSPPLSTVHRNSCLRFGAGLAASGNGCSCAQVSRAELIYSICRDGLHVPGMQPVVTHGFMSSWVLLGSSKHTIHFHEGKEMSSLGQGAITSECQYGITYPRQCLVFPDRVNPAAARTGTSDAIRGIIILDLVSNQTPGTSCWKTITGVTPHSHYKTGN